MGRHDAPEGAGADSSAADLRGNRAGQLHIVGRPASAKSAMQKRKRPALRRPFLHRGQVRQQPVP
ncbi:hypothetical protein FAS41_00325 [Pseudomonas nicosulfuronedens]|uniref:Uncharacterized protein n=1 Tax=Pseudomonas nicosulfuronedens TaxID=2571105 RepID=A0A5R9RD90_9PSED|nr:hypothetical protein FAS41_00325 [Pseudomonas nicosulfuronedens]